MPGDSGTVSSPRATGSSTPFRRKTGDTLWRFSTGEPIVQAPAVIDDRVYVPTELAGCIAWMPRPARISGGAENVMQFVAAGKARVYAVDRLGRLLVLNAASGAAAGRSSAEDVSTKLANTDTDRIYLVSDGGLIQCLREAEQTEPLMHGKERKEAAKAETQPQPKEVEKPAKKEPRRRSRRGPQSAAAAPKEEAGAQGQETGRRRRPRRRPADAKPPEGTRPPGQNAKRRPAILVACRQLAGSRWHWARSFSTLRQSTPPTTCWHPGRATRCDSRLCSSSAGGLDPRRRNRVHLLSIDVSRFPWR